MTGVPEATIVEVERSQPSEPPSAAGLRRPLGRSTKAPPQHRYQAGAQQEAEQGTRAPPQLGNHAGARQNTGQRTGVLPQHCDYAGAQQTGLPARDRQTVGHAELVADSGGGPATT
jgi:hypothetical protein